MSKLADEKCLEIRKSVTWFTGICLMQSITEENILNIHTYNWTAYSFSLYNSMLIIND